MLELTLAKWEEVTACVEILTAGRNFQREQGFVQWPDGYPGKEEVEEDIRTGKGFVAKEDGVIAAYLYIGFDGDPAYPAIKGAWHLDAPYGVIHRIAVAPAFRGKGLVGQIFRLAEEHCIRNSFFNLRIDTDEANLRMRHILQKNGFSYCGTVIQGGGDRLAFDKQLSK